LRSNPEHLQARRRSPTKDKHGAAIDRVTTDALASDLREPVKSRGMSTGSTHKNTRTPAGITPLFQRDHESLLRVGVKPRQHAQLPTVGTLDLQFPKRVLTFGKTAPCSWAGVGLRFWMAASTLDMALTSRRPGQGPRSPLRSRQRRQRLSEDIRYQRHRSMSRKGDCWDAGAESSSRR
jgi:hypothetical protein